MVNLKEQLKAYDDLVIDEKSSHSFSVHRTIQDNKNNLIEEIKEGLKSSFDQLIKSGASHDEVFLVKHKVYAAFSEKENHDMYEKSTSEPHKIKKGQDAFDQSIKFFNEFGRTFQAIQDVYTKSFPSKTPSIDETTNKLLGWLSDNETKKVGTLSKRQYDNNINNIVFKTFTTTPDESVNDILRLSSKYREHSELLIGKPGQTNIDFNKAREKMKASASEIFKGIDGAIKDMTTNGASRDSVIKLINNVNFIYKTESNYASLNAGTENLFEKEAKIFANIVNNTISMYSPKIKNGGKIIDMDKFDISRLKEFQGIINEKHQNAFHDFIGDNNIR